MLIFFIPTLYNVSLGVWMGFYIFFYPITIHSRLAWFLSVPFGITLFSCDSYIALFTHVHILSHLTLAQPYCITLINRVISPIPIELYRYVERFNLFSLVEPIVCIFLRQTMHTIVLQNSGWNRVVLCKVQVFFLVVCVWL